jgi:hypothetical protein
LGSFKKVYNIRGDDFISYSIVNFFFSDIRVYNSGLSHNINIFSKGNELILYLQTLFKGHHHGGVAQMVRA